MTAVASVAARAGALDEAPAGGAPSPSEQVYRSESGSSSSVSAASTGGSSETEGTDCVVLRLSGITHKKRAEDNWSCGRAVARNIRPLKRETSRINRLVANSASRERVAMPSAQPMRCCVGPQRSEMRA